MGHHRRSIRIPGFDYSAPGAYFVTICASKHDVRAGFKPAPTFGLIENGKMNLNESGRIIERAWRDLPDHYPNIDLDAFVVMPDHFHGIVVVGDRHDAAKCHDVGAIHELPLRQCQRQCQNRIDRRKMIIPKIIGRFKMNSSKSINILRGTLGMRVWQRNYYERIIRDYDEWTQLRAYIGQNPAQWTNKFGRGNS